MRDPIVGIDLGTSTSVVARADAGGHVTILADDSGYKVHPSVVSFHPSGGVIVGAAAKQRRVIDPQNTIYSVKRMIGRAFSSPEVQTTRQRVPFQIKAGDNELPLIVTRAGEFAAPEISAIVLDHVRNVASARLGTTVQRAIVTVPASFNDAQRSATATAGAIAGLEVVRVLNEPTAAALAYGHARALRSTIAVYDFGGGTFDITILQLRDHVYEVLGTAGDTFLGGDDLDERLVDKMVTKFLAENRIDLRANEIAMMRLRAVAEQTKIELSRRSRAVVRIDEIAYGARGKPLNFQIEITRDELIAEVSDLIDRTFPVCEEALRYAGLPANAVDDVILVGGSTKIPYVRDQVSRFFGKPPRTDISPEDAVAAGAALQAAALERTIAEDGARVAVPAQVTPADELNEAPTVDASLTEVGDLEQPVTMQNFTELSSPPVLPPRPRRITAGFTVGPPRAPDARAETEYSGLGAGTREVFEERTPVAQARTRAEVPDGTIGRLKTPGEERPARAHASRTVLGIPVVAPPPVPPVPPPPAPAPAPRGTRPHTSGDVEAAAANPRDALSRGAPSLPGPGARGPAWDPRENAPGAPAASPPTTTPRGTAQAPAPNVLEWGSADDFRTRPNEPSPLAPSAQHTPYARASTASPHVPSAPSPHVPSTPPVAPSPLAPSPPHAPHARAATASPLAPSAPPPVAPGARAPRRASTPPPVPPVPPVASMARPPTGVPVAPVVPLAAPSAQTLLAMEPPAEPGPRARSITGMTPLDLDGELTLDEPPAPAGQAAGAPLAYPAPMAPGAAPIVMEVTPRGLGIATVAGFCEELIRRNSRLPAHAVKMFTTSRDRQQSVRIVVCQGESRRLDKNTVIGDLRLENLPAQPRGETSIEVTFALDASGVLQVTARDAQTGAEQHASLDLVGGLREQDVAASRARLQQLRR